MDMNKLFAECYEIYDKGMAEHHALQTAVESWLVLRDDGTRNVAQLDIMRVRSMPEAEVHIRHAVTREIVKHAIDVRREDLLTHGMVRVGRAMYDESAKHFCILDTTGDERIHNGDLLWRRP